MSKRVLPLFICLLVALFCLFAACSGKEKVCNSIEKTADWTSTDVYEIKYQNETFSTSQDYIICLEKDPEKDFVILNLTDIQLGDGEISFGAEMVRRADKTIDELITSVHPDLITVTGDQSYGTSSALSFVGNLIDRYDIPWAPVFGNHDNQEDEMTTAQQAFAYENDFKNCLFKAGPNNLATVESGSIAYGNYIINVVEKDNSEKGFHVTKSLIFINSRDNLEYDEEQYSDQMPTNDSNYAMLSEKQIEWYKWAVSGVQTYGLGEKVTSAMFMHIPIYAYNLAFQAAYKTDVDMFDYELYNETVKNDNVLYSYADKSIWNEGYVSSVGGRREPICSPPYDDHVFDAILDFDDDPETDFISTDLVVAGHDHVNNFIINYQGVTLAYGLKTGSGCYYNDDLSGGSVIIIRDDGSDIMYHHFVDISVPLFPWWIYLLIAVGCAVIITAGILLLIKFKIIPIRKKQIK